VLEPLRPGDPRMLGPYRLRSRLGRGGMGQVYLGLSRSGRLVAVKVVRPELADDSQFRRRFEREVAAARAVAGFYTAPVVDADPDADPPWLVTAYIPGPTLYEAVQQQGPLPAGAIGVLGAGLAEGLAAIHDSGLVHRDLKPGNVILAEDGPRLIDFGIARALDETHTVDILGTPPFMSPEQATGAQVDTPSDVFSLGAVLVFAATGRSPFGTGQTQAMLYRVVHEEPDLTGLTELPGALTKLVAACLAKDPADRPKVPDLLDRLTTLENDATRWLPPTVVTMIAERRTAVISATKVDPLAGQDPVQPPAQSHTPRPSNATSLVSAIGAVVLVGLILLGALSERSDSASSQDASSSVVETTESTPDTTDPTPTPSSYETTTETTTSGFDPDSLDDASTDETPFTTDAFMPDEFTDDRGVRYEYEAGGTKACTDVDSDEARAVLTNNGCSEMIVANFVDDSNQIIATVFVFPFSDDETASVVRDKLQAMDYLDFGCWDPSSGRGAGACEGNVSDAEQWQQTGVDHRYVIVSQAMYLSLTSDDSVAPWLKSAVNEAVDAVGPHNYYDY
jgi:serine/threonine protein kinase